jgi:hypothetical protein
MLSPVSGFPNYAISNDGIIYSQKGEMTQQIYYGYKRVALYNKKQKHILVHRLVYQHFGKNWNPKMSIDHIDGNKENNHISNLRMATQQEQQFNKGVYKSNKLGVKGVHQIGNKYQARICINKKLKVLGRFETIEEASNAYQTKAKELHGEFYHDGNIFNQF